MELATNSYETIGKNADGTIRIKFILSTVPSATWTTKFNSFAQKIYSVKNSTSLILEDTAEAINQENIILLVQQMITYVDQQIGDDSAKNAVILSHLKLGNVVVHDSLSYDEFNEEDYKKGKRYYKDYLDKINN